MKTTYSIILMLCFSLVCKAQENRENASDSIAMISRAKADVVLSLFETIKAPKILYSIENKYYYLIIKNSPCYIEYYVSFDSSDNIGKIHFIETEDKTNRHQKQYKKLLSKAEPIFDLSKYNTNFITKIPNAKMAAGRPSYFVVQDVDMKRYGEYSLSSLTAPLPIDTNLWVYLVKKLSDEIARNGKKTR